MESSETVWARATRAIAGGASSNARLNPGLVVRRAEGAYLEGADGRRYVDYMMGLGPAILGHAPEPVLAAVVDSLRLGQTPAATHVLEIELAERVARLVPSAELVRFVATGTEAVQAVLRLARGHTGRAKVVKFEGHYHGWLDSILVSLHPDPALVGPAQRPNAVPGSRRGQAPGAYADVIVMPWNDLDALAALFAERGAEIAGVIMEPVMCNTCVIPPDPGYLEGVRGLCDAHGTVLIFDEVITGFRVALGGAQARFAVRPDLTVFAKAIAGGFPLACVAGRREIMALLGGGEVFHGGTYNATVQAVAAGLATLGELERDGGAVLRAIEARGEELMEGLRERALAHGVPLLVQGYGTIFNASVTDRNQIRDYRSAAAAVDAGRQAAFASAMLANGVRLSARGNWFVSAAHGEDEIATTLEAADAAFAEIA